jgi:hypothetical protein
MPSAGLGLELIHELASDCEIASSAAGGTTIAMHFSATLSFTG